VAIARAFILDPEVVLADEPVASLDQASGATVLELLRATSAQRGTTVLCSLHQVELARRFADRVVGLHRGKVVFDGPPSALDEDALAAIYESAPTPGHSQERRPPEQWKLRQPFGPKAIALTIVLSVLLGLSARHTDMDRMAVLLGEYAAHVVGLRKDSEVAKGVNRYISNALPMVLSEETPVSRIPGLDRAHLPLFSHLEVREETTAKYDFERKEMVRSSEPREVLVQPLGYLWTVLVKTLESIEIALWSTILGIAIGAPVAYFGARGYTPHPAVYVVARGFASYLRAIPELVATLFLVLAFGPGVIAGVLALGLHSAGFLGKFFADDVENADRGPQEALFSLGANRLEVLRYAVLPQVLPQFASYTQYILERNVRMATAIGIVGAGGIGVELKGRFDQYDFGHVTTILVVIFLTVVGLEQLTQWGRRRLM
jgi:phosphonate transport system permease protein